MNSLSLLGLQSLPSSIDELKAARRKAMRDAHPDRGGDTDDAARINAAYESLKHLVIFPSEISFEDRLEQMDDVIGAWWSAKKAAKKTVKKTVKNVTTTSWWLDQTKRPYPGVPARRKKKAAKKTAKKSAKKSAKKATKKSAKKATKKKEKIGTRCPRQSPKTKRGRK
jgi:hypothetical protein